MLGSYFPPTYTHAFTLTYYVPPNGVARFWTPRGRKITMAAPDGEIKNFKKSQLFIEFRSICPSILKILFRAEYPTFFI